MDLQQLELDYSLKNIPIPREEKYLKYLSEKIGLLVRRMLWKVHFFDKRQDSNEENRGNFGFKSPNTPSSNDYIKPF